MRRKNDRTRYQFEIFGEIKENGYRTFLLTEVDWEQWFSRTCALEWSEKFRNSWEGVERKSELQKHLTTFKIGEFCGVSGERDSSYGTTVSDHIRPCDFFIFPKVKSALKGATKVKKKTELLRQPTENNLQYCLVSLRSEYRAHKSRKGVKQRGRELKCTFSAFKLSYRISLVNRK